ncbi:molybdate transport system ATP-binding protein [Rubricella aquisinus]|uniref:Molybdate transport system ATP-binding protein n=1 Tax=Rubricella aquisinus TaxID=2028108 RepID=A0A840WH53_9RHOB|nr:molybdenum ABC transporter ATP-binding protein [Rubricella aquisinus]MBB5514448.1 molybdate transport system ATP-binding protein [Rubricella aquisinus]
MSMTVDIRHRFGTFTLDAGFEADTGVTALFGPSGAGKTSMINAVAGLLRPDRGRITVDSAVWQDDTTFLPPHKRRVGYVFQDGRLFPHLSVARNLRFAGLHAEEGAILDMLGIAHLMDRRIAALSGGEAQRVAIGRALLSDPKVLLLDEPLSALDAARKAEILPYIERLRDELRIPILLVSHAVEEVARLAQTVIVLDQGRITASGAPAALLAEPGSPMGPAEAGTLLPGTVGPTEQGLTRIDTGAGPILLPEVTAAPGHALRLRIPARDVMLATQKPEGLSALNILAGHIGTITAAGAGVVDVQVICNGVPILARITAQSAGRLGLCPGQPIYAVVKSVTLGLDQVFA